MRTGRLPVARLLPGAVAAGSGVGHRDRVRGVRPVAGVALLVGRCADAVSGWFAVLRGFGTRGLAAEEPDGSGGAGDEEGTQSGGAESRDSGRRDAHGAFRMPELLTHL
ncbi:MAG: hypothetical protein WCA46_23350 [Actinocatenispora sp.]